MDIGVGIRQVMSGTQLGSVDSKVDFVLEALEQRLGNGFESFVAFANVLSLS